ncbi:dihydrofolate reductase, partial [Candidatus Neomarinimicrobiota bacterium]
MKLSGKLLLPGLLLLLGCSAISQAPGKKATEPTFNHFSEQFADLYVARYQIPGFDELSLQQKKLAYYLYQAALSGRDIIWDQHYKYNLLVRRTMEAIVRDYAGDRDTQEFGEFMVYTKRLWFSNGIHHHYSTAKMKPGFSTEYFATLVNAVPAEGLPLQESQTASDLLEFLTPIIFDPNVATRMVNTDTSVDQVAESATNFYDGVTMDEVSAYYNGIIDKNDASPISYGLNSQLTKVDGQVTERVWKVGGMYGEALEKVVFWLDKAVTVAENEQQRKTLELLAKYLRNGNLEDFDAYNIAWVKDTDSRLDAVNGFIEVYGDPLAYRGSYAAIVNFKDLEATERIKAIGDQAQWFEDNSPLMEEHKKKNVQGISAKVITVVVEAGDASPSTPIGINLPNANWIRVQHGSKSVTLGNIVDAYNGATAGSGFLEEFDTPEQIELEREYGTLGADLHTDLHEVIGHASGVINPGVGTPKETLKSYSSTLEEARADLVAMYYLLDPKLVEIGVMPNLNTGKAEYISTFRNGIMTQLRRIKPGDNIEQAHMRARQLAASWVYEKGLPDKVIEKLVKDDKTYFVINDFEKMRELYGQLLR